MSRQQCYLLHKNEDYQNAIAQHANTHREVLQSETLPGGGVRRVARFSYQREMEGGLRAFLRARMPSFGHIETSEYIDETHGTWKIEVNEPRLLRSKVSGQGTVDFEQCGDSVVRRVEGHIDLKLPYLMAPLRDLAERVILRETESSLQRAAGYTPVWVEEHGLPRPSAPDDSDDDTFFDALQEEHACLP